MTADANALPPPPPRTMSPYVVAWAVIGLLAAAYLTVLAVRPELVSEHLPAFRPGEPEGNQGQRAMSKALAEVQGLRQSVSQVQLDVAKIKAEVSTHQERSTAIASRLATLEDKVSVGPWQAFAGSARNAGQAASAPEPSGQAAASAPASAAATGPAPAPAAAPAEKAATAKPAAKGAKLETGSLAAAAAAPKVINAPDSPPAAKSERSNAVGEREAAELISFGPAVVKPAAEPLGLRIASSTSLDALRLSWSLLADSHAQQLRNLEPRYVSRVADGNGDPSFELVAGPVRTPAEASRICKALAARGVACQVGTFGGAALQ